MIEPAPPAPPARPWRRRLKRAALATLGALLAALLVLSLALTRDPLDPAYAGPGRLDPEVLARFAYREHGTPVAELASWNHAPGSRWSTRWVQFEVTTPGEEAPHRVQVIHHRPEGRPPGRRPAVVLTPILGARDELPGLLAAALAGRGIHAAIVLRGERVLDPTAPEARIERVLRTAVVERRRTVDWLSGLEDVDPDRIGACGASLGGIATALLAATEPRLRASALLLAGGDLPEVLVTSDEPRLVRWRTRRGLPLDALRASLAREVVSDPLALAGAVDARRVLFVQARFDGSVPTPCQERLWQALGRPERWVLPTGHRTAGIYLPWLVPALASWFEERL